VIAGGSVGARGNQATGPPTGGPPDRRAIGATPMTGRDAVDAVAIVVALALFVVLVAEAVGHAAVLLHGPGHVLRGAAGPAWCPSPKPSGTLRRSGGTHTVIGFWHPIGPHGGETSRRSSTASSTRSPHAGGRCGRFNGAACSAPGSARSIARAPARSSRSVAPVVAPAIRPGSTTSAERTTSTLAKMSPRVVCRLGSASRIHSGPAGPKRRRSSSSGSSPTPIPWRRSAGPARSGSGVADRGSPHGFHRVSI
jgi:hypothetical protein